MNIEFWKNHHYQLLLTEDQSPTLRSLKLSNQETMHHRGGAYSEAQMIYGNPLRHALNKGAKSVLSMGLGLGYNELLVASEAIKKDHQSIQLLSFESDPFLVEQFLEFLSTKTSDPYLQIAKRFDENIEKMCQWLIQAKQSGNWVIKGALTNQTHFEQGYEVIFYDAFSSKSSSELWSEDFLNHFLKNATAQKCVFTTYACTGALKRALKNQGFQVTIREGFQSKRDSTLAER